MAKTIDKLIEIGFNRLEADVYIYLLSHPPATAYKIGKDINKPTANVYKAIDSLSQKGAVLVEDNKNKLCKAVNSDEFIRTYKNNLIERTNDLKSELNNLNKDTYDQNTYTVNSVALVFERFRTMMEKCSSIAVIDAFPNALNKVKPIIEDAAKRGIDIHVQAYKPIEIENTDVACTNWGDKALDHWDSQQLNLIIDGEEHLIALMDNDLSKVIQATWSNNIYMSCILHAGAIREQTMMKIYSVLENPDFESKTREILDKQKFFYNTHIPGFNKLSKLK